MRSSTLEHGNHARQNLGVHVTVHANASAVRQINLNAARTRWAGSILHANALAATLCGKYCRCRNRYRQHRRRAPRATHFEQSAPI
jgi:hypothetical protein